MVASRDKCRQTGCLLHAKVPKPEKLMKTKGRKTGFFAYQT